MLQFETGMIVRGYSNEKISNLILTLTTQFTESRSSVWLEHYTDNVGVSSSNLLGTTSEVLGYKY